MCGGFESLLACQVFFRARCRPERPRLDLAGSELVIPRKPASHGQGGLGPLPI